MAKERKIPIDELYKALKYHDLELLKHFNDDSLSDMDYLFYAICSDIISNSLSIVINIQMDNIKSLGNDNCCRSIIEAFVVLKMIAKGDISNEQAKIFRYHYAIVDYANMRKFVDDRVKQTEDFKYVERDRKKAFDILQKFHNCTINDLKNDPDLDDANFYLKKHLGDRINFSSLLEKYPISITNDIKMYDLFSIFAHPRFEINQRYAESIDLIREAYIGLLLDYVVAFLKETKLFVFDKTVSGFKEDFFENPILHNNVLNIRDTHAIFNSIENKICQLPDGFDSFTYFFLEKMRHLIIDMEVSISLGYREHIISMFKSAVEYIAIFSAINESPSLDIFKILKLAYCYSSRLQINNLSLPSGVLEEAGLGSTFSVDTIQGLRTLFDNYYKDNYKIEIFDVFLDKTKHNSRYFLSKFNNSFNAFVNKFIDDLYTDQSEKDFLKLIYRVSKDMNHGGGYSFNSSPGLIDSQCRHVQNTIYRYLYKFLLFSGLTLKEHEIDVDLSFELKFFEMLSLVEQNEIEKLNKEYFEKNDKKD